MRAEGRREDGPAGGLCDWFELDLRQNTEAEQGGGWKRIWALWPQERQGRVERQGVPTVRVSDLEPELGLWGTELILRTFLLPLHLSFQEGMTPTVGR